jgi:hypothetical protein
MLAPPGTARLREPRRQGFRLFSAAVRLVTTGRRRILRFTRHLPWTGEITAARDPGDRRFGFFPGRPDTAAEGEA